MYSIWADSEMIYPLARNAPLPKVDLPDDIKRDYEGARAIVQRSPRGAAALLRLCVQKVCKELGGEGNNLNTDIKGLVQRGLDVTVQQALDVVRVVGNDAVHPGQIDLRDDPVTASMLFGLVNFIADVMISQPKRIASLYAALPQTKRDEIVKWDGQTKENI